MGASPSQNLEVHTCLTMIAPSNLVQCNVHPFKYFEQVASCWQTQAGFISSDICDRDGRLGCRLALSCCDGIIFFFHSILEGVECHSFPVILFLSFFSCHSFPAWNGCRPEVHFSADNFPPSKVDLIKVIELFLCSTASFVTKTENEHHKITIDQNSVRYNAHFLDQELAAYLVSLYQLLLCLIQTNASTQK